MPVTSVLYTAAQSEPVRYSDFGIESCALQSSQLRRHMQDLAVGDAGRRTSLPDGSHPVAAVRHGRPQSVFAAAVAAGPVPVVPQRRLRRHVADSTARCVTTVAQQLGRHVVDRQLSTSKQSEVRHFLFVCRGRS